MELCLIIPCYNEEQRLKTGEILRFLESQPSSHVCLVNDGSSDGTLRVLENVRTSRPAQVTVVNLPSNRGKAEAVRQGVLHAAGSARFGFIGFWDADLSTPFRELDALVGALTAHPSCQLVMGSRVKRLGAHIERRVSRHVLGRVFSTFASALLGLPIYDSQCGAKLFRAEAVGMLFGEPFVTQWLFDLEIIARLRGRLGRDAALEAAIEVPLGEWIHVGGSKLRVSHMAKVPFELPRLRSHYRSR